MCGGIEVQELAIEHEHGLPQSRLQSGEARDLLHPIDVKLQVSSPFWSKPVRLASAGSVALVEAVDPLVFKQSSQCAIQCAGTQHHAAVTHALDVFQDRIAMLLFSGQAQKNEQDGLSQWQVLRYGFR